MRSLNIFYISIYHMYAVIIDYRFSYSYLLIYNKSSLKLQKTYFLEEIYLTFGKRTTENQNQIIFRDK